jgi:hypothetical protein
MLFSPWEISQWWIGYWILGSVGIIHDIPTQFVLKHKFELYHNEIYTVEKSGLPVHTEKKSA